MLEMISLNFWSGCFYSTIVIGNVCTILTADQRQNGSFCSQDMCVHPLAGRENHC